MRHQRLARDDYHERSGIWFGDLSLARGSRTVPVSVHRNAFGVTMMHSTVVVTIGTLLLGSFLLPVLAVQATAQLPQGKALYSRHCASCHGRNLEGQPDWRRRKPDGRLPAPPHDSTGHTWHHSDDHLFQITKLGTEAIVGGGYKSDMPGFGDVMSDEEIRAVLEYIKSTWPQNIQRRHDLLNGRKAP